MNSPPEKAVRLSRRGLLAAAAATGVHGVHAAPGLPRPRVAAIVTEFRENSHADVIVTKFAEGCAYPGAEFKPEVSLVALYMDQVPANDLGRDFAKRHGIPVYPTIRAALCTGSERLSVDSVLLIGEHGNYPVNARKQKQYPRWRFFSETAAVVREAAAYRIPPPAVFSDKHLSTHSWKEARQMVDTARELKMPFMAGSSLPVAWRRPELEYAPGVQLEEAMAVGYHELDAYGFHALETLQCMTERRKGGETGVRAVQCLSGEEVWRAGADGRWSRGLLEAALTRAETKRPGAPEKNVREPYAVLIDYVDGLRASMLMLEGQVNEFLFAGRRKGAKEPDATLFWLQEPKPFAHFARLDSAIQKMFLTRRPTYPVERTLLTTGILLAAHDSLYNGGKRVETPHLRIRYRSEERRRNEAG